MKRMVNKADITLSQKVHLVGLKDMMLMQP